MTTKVQDLYLAKETVRKLMTRTIYGSPVTAPTACASSTPSVLHVSEVSLDIKSPMQHFAPMFPCLITVIEFI